MIRTDILNEIKEWIEDNRYEIPLETIEAEYDLSFEESCIVEEMILDHEYEEEVKKAEAEAEEQRLMEEWEIERRYQEAEYREMVA